MSASTSVNPIVVTSIKLDIAETIQKQISIWTKRGISHGAAINNVARAFGKTPAFVYSQLSLLDLPPELLSLMREKPLSVSFVMKVWKESKGDVAKAKETLQLALLEAQFSGAKKAMPKHIN